MKRRRVLRVAGTALALPTVGCVQQGADGSDGVGDEPTDDETTATPSPNGADYEQCDRYVIWYSGLPGPVQREVDAALEEGGYVTEGALRYPQAVDPDATVLQVEETYYAADVSAADGTRRLSFAETTPTKGSTQELVLHATTAESLEVSVTVTDAAGMTVFEREDVAVDPDRDVYDQPRHPVTDEYGTYEVTLEIDDGRTETVSWEIHYTEFDAIVTIDEDDVSIGPESVADIEACPWE